MSLLSLRKLLKLVYLTLWFTYIATFSPVQSALFSPPT